VAGRGLYRGFSADDLGGIGVGFSLFDMPALANLAATVVAEEVALRRPVSVVITPAASPTESLASEAAESAQAVHDERSPDVPVRLVLASTGA
jgi:hypothetical protein